MDFECKVVVVCETGITGYVCDLSTFPVASSLWRIRGGGVTMVSPSVLDSIVQRELGIASLSTAISPPVSLLAYF